MKHVGFAIAAALVLASCADPSTTDSSDRDETGEIVEGGELGVFAVQEGDCVNWPDSADGVSSFESVACDVAHDAEIYELFDIAETDEFPGTTIVESEAEQGCLDAFEPFIGIDYQQSQWFFTFLAPSEGTWDAGDREVICLVEPAQGEPQLTMSLEGVAT